MPAAKTVAASVLIGLAACTPLGMPRDAWAQAPCTQQVFQGRWFAAKASTDWLDIDKAALTVHAGGGATTRLTATQRDPQTMSGAKIRTDYASATRALPDEIKRIAPAQQYCVLPFTTRGVRLALVADPKGKAGEITMVEESQADPPAISLFTRQQPPKPAQGSAPNYSAPPR